MNFFLRPWVVRTLLFIIILLGLLFSIVHCFGLEVSSWSACTSFEETISKPWIDWFSDMPYFLENTLSSALILVGVLVEAAVFAFILGWIYDIIRLWIFPEEEVEQVSDFDRIRKDLEKKTHVKGIKIGKNAKAKSDTSSTSGKAKAKNNKDDKKVLNPPKHGAVIIDSK